MKIPDTVALYVYRVFNNGREAEALTLKESRAIGLRPPKVKQ